MREMIANILSPTILSQADAICFTSNGVIKANRELVMGAGVAKAFADRWPWLPRTAGTAVSQGGNRVHIFENKPTILSFPTKNHWRNPSDIELIKTSAMQLMGYVEINKWERVYLPYPGIGKGGLSRHFVQSQLEPLMDDRITLLRIFRSNK
jgi:hypothetical protein